MFFCLLRFVVLHAEPTSDKSLVFFCLVCVKLKNYAIDRLISAAKALVAQSGGTFVANILL